MYSCAILDTVEAIYTISKGGARLPLVYKIDVLAAIKEKGYNTTVLRKEKLLSEGVIQSLREGKPISWKNIETVCNLLDCQPGDFMEYISDEK